MILGLIGNSLKVPYVQHLWQPINHALVCVLLLHVDSVKVLPVVLCTYYFAFKSAT